MLKAGAAEGSEEGVVPKTLDHARLALSEHIKKTKDKLKGALPIDRPEPIAAANACATEIFPPSALSTSTNFADEAISGTLQPQATIATPHEVFSTAEKAPSSDICTAAANSR